MTTTSSTSRITLLKEDFERLTSYMKGSRPPGSVHEKQAGKSLSEELENAVVVTSEKFPEGIVRLNSTAIIKDVDTNRVITVTIVLPEQADVKKNRISVLAPLGTALIGYKKGQRLSWDLPSGKKNFIIMEVYHSDNAAGKKPAK